jgi:hypothetical protein
MKKVRAVKKPGWVPDEALASGVQNCVRNCGCGPAGGVYTAVAGDAKNGRNQPFNGTAGTPRFINTLKKY